MLNRLIAEAAVLAGGDHPCAVLGHVWERVGGAHCGCFPDAPCSVPVHKCSACGDDDYGKNAEADDIRKRCEWRAAAADSSS